MVTTVRGIQIYTVVVTMFPKGVAMTFASSAGGMLRDSPTGSIEIPANSLRNADGTPYDGQASNFCDMLISYTITYIYFLQVLGFVSFIDPSMTNPTVAPDLFIAPQPGSGDPNPTPLISSGIIQLALEDTMGNPLQANGVCIRRYFCDAIA